MKRWICYALLCAMVLSGCSSCDGTKKIQMIFQSIKTEGFGMKAHNDFSEDTYKKDITPEQETLETNWSEYFDGFTGAAVMYDCFRGKRMIYHKELAMTQNSPCSTFKIISSLIALENGIIQPDHSTYEWSGETFWNEQWNRDLDFSQAFRESCVWYFRKVIDKIGKERMQEELNKLQYGNCDISDWEGRQNTNNNNRALTGFWLESSLAISPVEQAEVMERIFGKESVYSENTQEELKKVMLLPEHHKQDFSIYGKTGMGKANGIVVDAWFTGFAETEKGNIYFCIYLGETGSRNVSSTVAKEIAVQIVSDYVISHSF